MSKDQKKKKSRTNWFILLINAGFMIALILSYLAAYFKPSVIGYIALFGLAYPFILLVNALFIFYWLFKKPIYALLSTGVILIGITHVMNFMQVSFPTEKQEGEKSIKIMTYNVRLFGLYEGKEKINIRNKIFDLLNREKADIICFQEFFQSDTKNYFITRDSLIKFLPVKYYHERYTHALNGKNYFGEAMFSKYPIVNKGYIPFESDVNNFCIYADILIHQDTIRVYNTHFQSIRFRPEDYAFVSDNKNKEELKKGGTRIARRLKTAFKKRESQVEKVAANISECPYPVILCGDFNDSPVSYTYRTFSDRLTDSFREAGNGISNTYIGVFPSFRIDYIFHSPELKCIRYQALPDKLSDHYPVVATLIRTDK